MVQQQHFTLRLPQRVLECREEQAAARGATKTALAERYLAEAVAVAEHPGIVFRDGPAGRRSGSSPMPRYWPGRPPPAAPW